MNAYYTHQKYLQKEIDNLKNGSILLELGVGVGSSSVIHNNCKTKNITAIAFESDYNWLNNMCNRFELPNYKFIHIKDWKLLAEYLHSDTYDLVFVDQAPWSARIDSINMLKNITKTFIVHDYDYFNENKSFVCDEKTWWNKNYANQFSLEENYELKPPTLIMRNKNADS